MSGTRFVLPILVAALVGAALPARAMPTFCWQVRCLPTGRCVVPPDYIPTVDYPAPTIPYSVWFYECFRTQCGNRPSGSCD